MSALDVLVLAALVLGFVACLALVYVAETGRLR